MGRDIDATELSGFTWNEAEIDASLSAIRSQVEAEAVRAIDWYFRRKRSKALLSRGLRLASIVSASAGGLLPIAASWAGLGADAALSPGLGASLLVGLAAALVGLDSAFGFSSGWIRYVTTANLIRRDLAEFRMEWTVKLARAHGAPDHEKVLELLALARGLRLRVEDRVMEETNAWVNEFKGSQLALERVSVKADSPATGGGPSALHSSAGRDVAPDSAMHRALGAKIADPLTQQ